LVGIGALPMSDLVRQFAVAVCCLGMGAWPVMQHYGCCCATVASLADKFDAEQRADCCCGHEPAPPVAPAPDPSKCKCPVAAKAFEAIPSFAIKTYTQDFGYVDAVFTSAFQAARPNDETLWEVVENLRPSRVPRHVLFCAFLE